MAKRFVKLYPVFLVGILVHALAIAWWRSEGWDEWLLAYAAKLSLLTNFMPGLEVKVSGPWWFWSFVFQFYMIFYPMRWLVHRYGDRALLACAVLGWAAMGFVDPAVPVRLKFTVLGWLPELSFGIYLARHKDVRLGALHLAGS